MNQVCMQNEEILHKLKKELSEKITSEKVREKVLLFLYNAEKLMANIEQAIPPETDIRHHSASNGNMAEIFRKNTQLLLGLVPENKKTTGMERFPQYFINAINQIIKYLKGDDSWLQDPASCSTGEVEGEANLVELSIEKKNVEISAEPEPEYCVPEEKNAKASTNSDLGYPVAYHALSKQVKLNHVLDPLFDLIFPKNTYLLSVKHCKETTGKALNTVLTANLGPGEDGNTILYKIFTDDVLKKIFKDDRIIIIFNKSINIALLKVVVFTALYRLQKAPEKFPMIGGVSYFIDFEEEMLQTSHISETMFQLLMTPAGSMAIFHLKSSQERQGFISFLQKNKEMNARIYTALSETPDKAKTITRYWPPKFSSLLIVNSSMHHDEISRLFSSEQLDDIKQFLQYM